MPSLRTRWQTQPQRGELLGVSASVAGEMVGLAVAELFVPSGTEESIAELLSLFVLPSYRHRGISTALVRHLRNLVRKPLLNDEIQDSSKISDIDK